MAATYTHTNRKGVTYHLCRGVTKTGKARYFFARHTSGKTTVPRIPKGYEVAESVNGVVSLARAAEKPIRPEETRLIEDFLQRTPRLKRYRTEARKEFLLVFEPLGADPQELADAMGTPLFARSAAALERHTRYDAVFRLRLLDPEKRHFSAERMCYLGGIEDWILLDSGSLPTLAKRYLPHLGRESFFELI